MPGTRPVGTAIVSDPLEIRRLLSRASEGHTLASLKLRGNETVLKTHVLCADPKQGIHLEFDEKTGMLNPDSFESLTRESPERECMLLMYIEGRFIFGINAEPVEIRKDRMVFAPPVKVFKIQRRKDVRFVIPSAYEFTVEIESLEQARTRVHKRLIDISESGLSFFVLSPREAALFRPGLVLSRCFVHIQNHSLPVMLKVRNRGKHERGAQGAGNKIGVEFEQISPDDRTYLGQFVYSHAQHLFY
jgi:hypothetical protein